VKIFTSMGERKPPGVTWESWIERQIRDGVERGAFTGLPGAGKPIPGRGQQDDELWWVRKKLASEGYDDLPPTLAVRRELDAVRARIAATADETEVRRLVAAINERIRHVNSHTVSGPPSTLGPLDVDEVVERWREARHGAGT
jgi:hypothetical protein